MQVLVDNDGKSTTGVTRTDNEGAPVAGIDQVLAYTYNVKGEVTEMKRDNNVDGKYDYREAYTLDANGRQIQKEIDLTNDGQFDRKEVYTREADDGLVQTDFYNLIAEGNSTRDVLTKKEYYELNANNQRVAYKNDKFGDGSIEDDIRYELDSQGRVHKQYGGNLRTYTYDANGYLLKEEVDVGKTGSVDVVNTYERDSLGRVIKSSTDSDNDGIVDSVHYYELDVYGNIIKDSYDVGDNGKMATITEKEFNELNQEVVRYFDRTGDGLTNDDSIYHYTYDEYGLVKSTTSMNAITKQIDSITYSTYNSVGERVSSKVDNGGDGSIDSHIEFEYDGLTGVINKRIYMDPNTNKITYTLEHEVNKNGTVLITYRDNLGDGTIEQLQFGSFGGQYTLNHTEDFTTWSTEKLEKIKGLNQIILSSPSYETTIHLDSTTLAAISPSGRTGGLSSTMSVNGDATDTVNLSSDFKKLSTTRNIGANTFDMYSTEVDGKTYTLYIDNDVQTVIG